MVSNGVPAAEVNHLSCRFGSSDALDDVSLTVPAGGVFGLIGVNGAGKSTLLRHLIGEYRPRRGTARVLGRDPIDDRVEVLSRVGYVGDRDDLPRWATAGELMDFHGAVRRGRPASGTVGWDRDLAESTLADFDLHRRMKVSAMSRGQRARLAMLLAVSHRPELLILDEPDSGLDPIARDDLLAAVIRSASDDGRTVLFSGHLLSELSRVCDRVAMLHGGRVVAETTTEELDRRFREVVVKSDAGDPPKDRYPYAWGWQRDGDEWSAIVDVEAVSDETATTTIGLTRWFEAHARSTSDV